MTEATERAPVAPLHSFPRHLPLPLFSFPRLLSSPSISLALCCREAAMDARGPPLRPMPRRPCRRRRLGRPPCPLQELRADPAAWRPPPTIRCRESPDPAPLQSPSPSFVRSRYLPGARSSGERRHKTLPPLPRSSPWRSSPLHLNRRWSPQGPAMEVAASPVSIRLPPDPRRSSRDPPPVTRRVGPPRPAPRPTWRAGRPRPSPSSGRTCGLGSPTASAPASSPPCRPRPPPRR
ncbi:hypothetical protein VPH35_049493 [Triticum aestivum]